MNENGGYILRDIQQEAPLVRIHEQDLHFHTTLASSLKHFDVDTLLASIGQGLRKLHFRVTCSEMIWYMFVKLSARGDTFGGKNPPSR